MKRLFSFFAILSLLSVASCMQDPEADFRAPTVSASCTPGSNYGEVTLTIQVSNKHFKDCGFWYGTSSDLSDKKSLPVSGISGQSTGEARLTGLETGITYYFQAYVNSGRTSVTSSILHFTLDDVMNVDTDGFVVSYPETDLQVRVETTLPITVDLGGADWIEEIQTKGLDVYNKVFHISRNTELADRSATIRIASTNGKFKKDIPVQQSGCPITIPDAAFKAYMVEHFDKNGDGEIVVDEAEAIEVMEIGCSDKIASLQGIEYCTHLKKLWMYGPTEGEARGSGALAQADVSNCLELEHIDLWGNQLTKLDLSKNTKLRVVILGHNRLTSMDVSTLTDLQTIRIEENQLTSITLPKTSSLTELIINDNKLTSLNLDGCPSIEKLSLQGNPIDLPDIWSLPLVSLHLSGLVSGQPADFLTHFPNLESVNISGYNGATLDLSKNTKLRDVWCWDMGGIQVLDLSAAPGLKVLYCAAYDGSGWNKNLKAVYVHSGVVFDVLVKNESTAIYYTDGNNHLNISPSNFEIDYKAQVFTVTIDSNLDVEPDLGDVKWISFYEQSENTLSFKAARNYTTDDRQATFIIRTGNGQLEKEVKVTQTGGPIEIPDAVFKQYMVDHFDQDLDGEITPAEARVIESIDITTDDIVTLQGIEFCPRLKYLKCTGIDGSGSYGSGKLAYVDVTHCPELEELVLCQNVIKELNVTQCPKLRYLHPARNLISSLDVSKNPELERLWTDYNLLTSLDLSNNPKLYSLFAYYNQIKQINLSGCSELQVLEINDCGLTNIDLSGCPKLQVLKVHDNRLSTIDISHNPLIYCLCLQGNPMELPDIWSLPLTELHVCGMVKGQPEDFLTHFPNLESVNFGDYDGTSIDLSQNTKLKDVWCNSMNKIKVLDLSAAPNLRVLYCNTWGANSFVVYLHPNVQLEDFDKDPDTKFYYTDGNDHLTVTPTFLEMDYPEAVFTITVDSNLDVSTDMGGIQWITPTTIAGQPKGTLAFKVARNNNTESRTATFSILAGGGKLQKEVTVNQAAGPIEIPDAPFKQYMVNHFDKDGDGEITPNEASIIEEINFSDDNIASLQGLEYCTHLKRLICNASGAGKLSHVELVHFPELEDLFISAYQVSGLDLSKCSKLNSLRLVYNQLSSIDLSHNPELASLTVERNLLTEIDLSHNPKLVNIDLYINNITEIDLSNNPKLEILGIANNKLGELDISKNPNLIGLNIDGNKITSLDLSHNPKIKDLNIQGNPLEQMPDIWSLSLTSLHVSGLVKGLPSDFLTHFPDLVSVNFWSYDGASIDLSQNTKLKEVWCGGLPQMTVLDFSAAPGLHELYCRDCPNVNTIYVHTGVIFDALEKDDHAAVIYK